MEILKKKLSSIPKQPGVYKFLDESKNILYIGKAKDLSKRVPSYFRKNIEHRPYVQQMLPLVRDIEWITTENEIEALILESALIKEHNPKYNLMLKDDKSYA